MLTSPVCSSDIFYLFIKLLRIWKNIPKYYFKNLYMERFFLFNALDLKRIHTLHIATTRKNRDPEISNKKKKVGKSCYYLVILKLILTQNFSFISTTIRKKIAWIFRSNMKNATQIKLRKRIMHRIHPDKTSTDKLKNDTQKKLRNLIKTFKQTPFQQ